MKNMAYINILPSELRRELKYYQNSIYRIMLNNTFKRCGQMVDNNSCRETIQDMRQKWPFNSPSLKFEINSPSLKFEINSRTLESLDNRYSVIFYYIPDTEFVTPRTLITYLHSWLCFKQGHQIREWNYALRTGEFNQQIVPYYYNEENVEFLIIPVDHILNYKVVYSDIE
jgi:hypothetical protein